MIFVCGYCQKQPVRPRKAKDVSRKRLGIYANFGGLIDHLVTFHRFSRKGGKVARP